MSDFEVIDSVLSGDSSSFKLLVDKYQQMVFRTAMGFVHSKEDAEDITQDVFLQVYRSLDSFQRNSEFSTWLYRITLNISLNLVNKNRYKNLFVNIGDAFSGLFYRASEEKNAQQTLESKEIDLTVQKAIDSLNEKQRKAFILSKYEELSQKEIAEIMQTSEGAVEQLLQRAKNNLQKKLTSIVGK